MKERMEEPYDEGVAIHVGPESCGGGCKASAEALTGVRMGAVLSREINHFRAPTLLIEAEGNTASTATARCVPALRGRRPAARAEPSCARTGRSSCRPWMMEQRDAPGRLEAKSRR